MRYRETGRVETRLAAEAHEAERVDGAGPLRFLALAAAGPERIEQGDVVAGRGDPLAATAPAS